MHTLGTRVDLFLQRIGIGTFQFRKAAPFQNFFNDVMSLYRQFFKNIDIRGPLPRFRFAAALQAHLVEQNLADLFGRSHIERRSGQ